MSSSRCRSAAGKKQSADYAMSRNTPQSRGKNRMPQGQSQARGIADKNRIVKSESPFRSIGRVLMMDRNAAGAGKSPDAALTSAVLRDHRVLATIQKELDHISKNLKSTPPDAEVLSEAFDRVILSAIKHSILDSELRSLALTDDLTRLYNRRAFYALSTQQLKVMRRKGQGLLLFFADVDHLKHINDTHGHR